MPKDLSSLSHNYLFCKGDGDKGNYPRALVHIPDPDTLPAALRALTANLYVTRSRARRHIIRTFDVDGYGGADSSVHGTVYEGPDGETAFGGAWLTSELRPVEEGDIDYLVERFGEPSWALSEILDRAAWIMFRGKEA